jgi:hypothetical protein
MTINWNIEQLKKIDESNKCLKSITAKDVVLNSKNDYVSTVSGIASSTKNISTLSNLNYQEQVENMAYILTNTGNSLANNGISSSNLEKQPNSFVSNLTEVVANLDNGKDSSGRS